MGISDEFKFLSERGRVMCKYVIKKENDIKYYNNGAWVSKEKAEEFNWNDAENITRELKHDGFNVIIESK